MKNETEENLLNELNFDDLLTEEKEQYNHQKTLAFNREIDSLLNHNYYT